MYRCDNCDVVSPPHEKRHAVVVATKSHQFPFREAAHRFRVGGKEIVKDDPGGTGPQIAREIGVCASCRSLIEGDV